jgi:hypothetical protein
MRNYCEGNDLLLEKNKYTKLNYNIVKDLYGGLVYGSKSGNILQDPKLTVKQDQDPRK